MYRNVLVLSGVALMAAGPAFAQYGSPILTEPFRGGPMDIGNKHYGAPWPVEAAPRFNKKQTELLIRWGDVGKCVSAKDHDASVAYVTSKPRSMEAAAAAVRLDTAFASCFNGSGIIDTSNKRLRRAAIADALGIKLST